MAKTSILDLPIYTWTPVQDGQPCIARIADLPMFFTGKTPMQAHMAADAWRKEEVGKIKAREAAKAARIEAARAARAARKNDEAA